MTNSALGNSLKTIADKYSLKLEPIANGFEMVLAEESETFEILDESDEYILMADDWHQHCETVDSLTDLMTALFEGNAWVVLKKTGHLLGGYKLIKNDGGTEVVLRETGMENEPAMRPKRLVRITYKNGVRSSHRVE